MNKGKSVTFIIILCISMFLSACFSDDAKDFIVKSPEEFNDIPSWILYLSELEQEQPQNFYVKKALARAYLVSNDWAKADLYINQAEKRMPRKAEPAEKYEVFAYKAQMAFRKEEFEDSMKYIEKALKSDSNDPMLLVLTKANILSKQENDSALEIYNDIWDTASNKFGKTDVELYFGMLAAKGDWEKALKVLTRYFNQTGYQSGLGLHFSIVYENMGMIPESILSIYFELLYQRDYGAITQESIKLGLDAVNEKIGGSYNKLTSALLSVSDYKFDDVEVLMKSDVIGQDAVFLDYVTTQIQLHSDPSNQSVIKKYIDLEWKYRALPSYYYVLWTNLKAGGETYSLPKVQGLLEKTIALNPSATIAYKSRIELGRLLGLNKSDSSKMLVGPEIDNIAYRYASSENIEVLDPCRDMLELQNNEYTDAVVNMFIQLKQLDSRIVDYLSTYSPQNDIAKIRIDNILKY